MTGDNYELSPFKSISSFGGTLLRPRPLDMATCIQLFRRENDRNADNDGRCLGFGITSVSNRC